MCLYVFASTKLKTLRQSSAQKNRGEKKEELVDKTHWTHNAISNRSSERTPMNARRIHIHGIIYTLQNTSLEESTIENTRERDL